MIDDRILRDDRAYADHLGALNEKISLRQPNAKIGSPLWMEAMIQIGFNIDKPHAWQPQNLSRIQSARKDTFLTSKTGSGKSILIHGSILADRIIEPTRPTLALVVEPLRALMDDQERAARERGLRAIAVHRESVTRAAGEKRSLWKEIEQGMWDIVLISPEMLATKAFDELAKTEYFMKAIRYCFIDEAHIVLPWGAEFRPMYLKITTLRNTLPRDTIFVAMSASIASSQRAKIQKALSFVEGLFYDENLPTDRREIKYCPRFLTHSTTGHDFPDLAWLLPESLDTQSDIQNLPRVLIAVDTIEKATRVIDWLEWLLEQRVPRQKHIVQPFHSLMSPKDRQETLRELKNGPIRFVVATMAGNVGLDMDIDTVVILDLPKSFEAISQWAGRASRRGEPGTLVVYGPSYLRALSWEDTSPDAFKTGNRRKRTPQQITNILEKQKKHQNVIVRFFDHRTCRRQTSCEYYGEVYDTGPEVCCNKCQPDDEAVHEASIKQYVKMLNEQSQPRTTSLEAIFPALEKDKAHQESVRSHFELWRVCVWMRRVELNKPEHDFMGPELILVESSIEAILGKIHTLGNEEVFFNYMHSRKEEFDFEETSLLWEIVNDANIQSDELETSRKAAGALKKAAAQKKNPKVVSQDSQGTPNSQGQSSKRKRGARRKRGTAIESESDNGEDEWEEEEEDTLLLASLAERQGGRRSVRLTGRAQGSLSQQYLESQDD